MEKGIFQFKIELQGLKPPVWRRILISDESTFWDLHVAIQDSMGWLDCHLHAFMLSTGQVGIPNDYGFDDSDIRPGWEILVRDEMKAGSSVEYQYDFGDDWVHTVTLEKVLKADSSLEYPVCVAGKRACPPEDCGGVWGYKNLLDILADPKHPEYEDYKEWIGDEFDSEVFSPDSVKFCDSAQRLKNVQR